MCVPPLRRPALRRRQSCGSPAPKPRRCCVLRRRRCSAEERLCFTRLRSKGDREAIITTSTTASTMGGFAFAVYGAVCFPHRRRALAECSKVRHATDGGRRGAAVCRRPRGIDRSTLDAREELAVFPRARSLVPENLLDTLDADGAVLRPRAARARRAASVPPSQALRRLSARLQLAQHLADVLVLTGGFQRAAERAGTMPVKHGAAAPFRAAQRGTGGGSALLLAAVLCALVGSDGGRRARPSRLVAVRVRAPPLSPEQRHPDGKPVPQVVDRERVRQAAAEARQPGGEPSRKRRERVRVEVAVQLAVAQEALAAARDL